MADRAAEPSANRGGSSWSAIHPGFKYASRDLPEMEVALRSVLTKRAGIKGWHEGSASVSIAKGAHPRRANERVAHAIARLDVMAASPTGAWLRRRLRTRVLEARLIDVYVAEQPVRAPARWSLLHRLMERELGSRCEAILAEEARVLADQVPFKEQLKVQRAHAEVIAARKLREALEAKIEKIAPRAGLA